MRITPGDVHYSFVISKINEAIPANSSEAFKKGYEAFYDYIYLACLEQEAAHRFEDQSIELRLEEMFIYIFNEVQKEISESRLTVDPMHFWGGYFKAQETTEQLFKLAYNSEILAA